MPAAVRRLLPLWYYPEGFESRNKFRLLMCCGQHLLAASSSLQDPEPTVLIS